VAERVLTAGRKVGNATDDEPISLAAAARTEAVGPSPRCSHCRDDTALRHDCPVALPQHCFTYGTLMCDDIMSAVCNVPAGTLEARPARLENIARHPVVDEPCPGLLPCPGAKVNGVVYLNLPPSAWVCLDTFEGKMYERQSIPVSMDNEADLNADIYVFRIELVHRLAVGDWDFAKFLREEKARFTGHYLGFERLLPAHRASSLAAVEALRSE
jgi:gamma-glutamyl AIG2-like cyclotransferase